ncbi:MAG: hypothetical protein ABI655_03780 [Phenylobacterium sp.]
MVPISRVLETGHRGDGTVKLLLPLACLVGSLCLMIGAPGWALGYL